MSGLNPKKNRTFSDINGSFRTPPPCAFKEGTKKCLGQKTDFWALQTRIVGRCAERSKGKPLCRDLPVGSAFLTRMGFTSAEFSRFLFRQTLSMNTPCETQTRRDFLKSSALAGGILAAPAILPGTLFAN